MNAKEFLLLFYYLVESKRIEREIRSRSFIGLDTEFNIALIKLALAKLLFENQNSTIMNDDERIKKAHKAYKEFCNCGYNGTFLEYLKSVDFKVEKK